jgi:hypothetical protein
VEPYRVLGGHEVEPPLRLAVERRGRSHAVGGITAVAIASGASRSWAVIGVGGVVGAVVIGCGRDESRPDFNCPGGRGLIHQTCNWRASEDKQHERPPEAACRDSSTRGSDGLSRARVPSPPHFPQECDTGGRIGTVSRMGGGPTRLARRLRSAEGRVPRISGLGHCVQANDDAESFSREIWPCSGARLRPGNDDPQSIPAAS